MTEFVEFPKMARLSREVIITEKIDGTNASVWISEDLSEMKFGSRTRWITPQDDNYGFAAWAQENREELMKLGAGHHFGEWWGRGIQRNYSMTERVYSLFNVSRWSGEDRPACCRVVPILYQGQLEQFGVMNGVKNALRRLEEEGSQAAPGFMKPEGIVVWHTAANIGFKKTLEKDEMPKSRVLREAVAA